MKKYVVYEHVSPSGKIYVGQSCQLNVRWEGNGSRYLNKNKEGKFIQRIFANALLKYGWDNFEHRIILEGVSKSEADYAEKYLIKWYKLHKMSYNITDGGEGTTGIERHWSQEMRLYFSKIRQKYNPRTGQHHTEETKRKISIGNKGKKVDAKGRDNMSKAHLGTKSPWRWRKIYAFDKNTKKLVAEFSSITEAAKHYNLTSCGITQSASGKCSTAGNYVWSYFPSVDEDDVRFDRAEDRNIYCYDKQYNLVGTYKNITEAAMAINGNKYSLANCCCGNCLTYKGYIWTRTKIENVNNFKKEVICA